MKLAAVFTDGAVLQREMPIVIRGESDPCSMVVATLNGMAGMGIVGLDGRFQLRLPAQAAGGPYELEVRNRDTGDGCVLRDILIGEVWLASGQSNMSFTLGECPAQHREFPVERLASGRIRYYDVPRRATGARESDSPGRWVTATEKEIASFSAVALWFAEYLERNLDVPVGILKSSWGGTCIQAWTSREALMTDGADAEMLRVYDARLLRGDVWRAASRENLERGEISQQELFPFICRDDPGNAGYPAGWAAPDFDDSSWRNFSLPGCWTQARLAGNGVVWVRREVELPPEWAGREVILHTGGIDKTDITYFNGVEVGASGSGICDAFWNVPRTYRIPGELVKADRNVIAIRAFSYLFDGQFMGSDSEYYLELESGSERINFAGRCRFECEVDFGWHPLGMQIAGPMNPNTPAILFDGMIRPLIPYTIRGVIWYQGETNAISLEEAREYERRIRTMIADWRYRWGQGEFPFYQVQLANFRKRSAYDANSIWAPLREGQRRAARALRRCGMAVAIDCGDADDIHPQDKRTVGERLARLILHDVYCRREPLAAGPMVTGVFALPGNEVRIEFSGCDGSLATRDGAAPTGFFLASGEGVFHAAEARIEGDAVIVHSAKVASPTRVRFGWADNPELNLVNGAGFPASPFEEFVE